MKRNLFLVEGEVSDLVVGRDVINLISKHQGVGNKISGVAGVLANQFGAVGNAALVESYEGEEVESFACIVGEHLIQGTFISIMFNNGDLVKIVAERPSDKATNSLVAHAVLRPDDGLLSMPYGTGRGVKAEMKKKLLGSIAPSIFTVIFSAIICSFINAGLLVFFAISLGGIFFSLILALWSQIADPEGPLSTAIFETLGFKNPKSLNLTPSALCPYEGYMKEHGIFRYRRVVKAEDDPHGSPEPEPLKRWDIAVEERAKAASGQRSEG